MKKRSAQMRTTMVVLAAVGLLAGTSAARAAEVKVVNVMAGDGFQYSLQHIASHGGFFAAEGLDVESVDAGSGSRQAAALMGGSAAFGGFGLVQAIKANAKGGNLVAVSAMLNSYDQQVVVSTAAAEKMGIEDGMSLEDRIHRMRDLRIAITSPGSTTDIIVRSLLKMRGMNADEALEILPMGGGSNMLAAMERDATDAFIWAAPQAQMAVARGVGKIIVNPLSGEVDEMAGVRYLTLVTSRDTLQQKPEVIRAAVRALTKAMAFVQSNPEEARVLVRKQFPDVDEDVFDAAWAGYRNAIPKSPVIDRESYDNTVAWLNLTAEPAVTTPYDDVVDPRFAKAAAAELLGN